MMSPNKLATLYKPIRMEMDLEARTGRMSVPGVFDTEVGPIRNPVTGTEHRARINLPHGFEYHLAEIAKGSTETHGQIALRANNDSHAHLLELHISGKGVVETA